MSHDEPLSLRQQLAYGCGDFASVLFWQTFMKYLPFYYTEVFGLSAAALGSMLLFSRVLDGITDPMVGVWADRTETRWGKFRPFILFAAPPFALFGVLTFSTPDFSPSGKLIWAYLTYNGLMLLYTIVNIPYTAMLGVMTADPAARTRLSSVKFMFAFSAGMVISATLLPMARFLGNEGQDPQLGWQLAFVIVSTVAFAFLMVTFLGTRERIVPQRESSASISRDFRLLLSNRAWLLLLATTLTFILFISVRSSVFAHYFKYTVFEGNLEGTRQLFGVELSFDALVSTFNTAGQALSVVGVFLTAALAGKLRKRPLFLTSFSLAILATAAYFVVPPTELNVLFLLEVLGSAAGAPIPVLLWAMYADTADYGEHQSGRRTTGLVFSASTMGQKIGWAVGGYFAFQLLGSVGFAANVLPDAAVRQSLVWLMSLAPALIGLVSMAIFFFYPLDEEKMEAITANLNFRRSRDSAGSSSPA